jgi:hypothetical protein
MYTVLIVFCTEDTKLYTRSTAGQFSLLQFFFASRVFTKESLITVRTVLKMVSIKEIWSQDLSTLVSSNKPSSQSRNLKPF